MSMLYHINPDGMNDLLSTFHGHQHIPGFEHRNNIILLQCGSVNMYMNLCILVTCK